MRRIYLILLCMAASTAGYTQLQAPAKQKARDTVYSNLWKPSVLYGSYHGTMLSANMLRQRQADASIPVPVSFVNRGMASGNNLFAVSKPSRIDQIFRSEELNFAVSNVAGFLRGIR